MSDYASFSMRLQHQLTGALYSLGGIMVLYLYATATDMSCFRDWLMYKSSGAEYVDSWKNRHVAYLSTVSVLWATLITTYPAEFSWVPKPIQSFCEKIRTHLMHRSLVRLAPAYRILCLLFALCLLALSLGLVIVGVLWKERKDWDWSEGQRAWKGGASSYTYWNLELSGLIFAPCMSICAAFAFVSKASPTKYSIWQFIATNRLISAVQVIAFLFFIIEAAAMKSFELINYDVENQNKDIKWGGPNRPRVAILTIPAWVVMLGIGLAIPFVMIPVAKRAREVLATYPEAKIQSFLQKVLVATTTAVPSMFFICSQSFGCVLKNGKYVENPCDTAAEPSPDKCVPFVKFNLVVVVNMTLGLLLFYVSGFWTSHGMDDYVKFTDASLPFFIHLVVRGLTVSRTMGAIPPPMTAVMKAHNITLAFATVAESIAAEAACADASSPQPRR